MGSKRGKAARQGSTPAAPRVSVIIPTFNRAPLVPRAIASVLAQTMPDFELVVVDDGSTDDTAAVVSAIADPRLRLLRIANRGDAGARNAGIAASTAPLVAYLDSDNEWRPEFLAAMTAALGPDDVMAHCWMELVEVDGPSWRDEGRRTVYRHGTPTASSVFEGNVLDTSLVLHRRSVLADVGPWRQDVRPADWEFYARIVLRYPGAVRRVNAPLLTYYRYPSTLVPQLSNQPTDPRVVAGYGLESVRPCLEAFARDRGRWDDPLSLFGPLRLVRPTLGMSPAGWTGAVLDCVLEATAVVARVGLIGDVPKARPPAALRAWVGGACVGAISPIRGRFAWELAAPLAPGDLLRLRIETTPPFAPGSAGSPDARSLGFVLAGLAAIAPG